MDLAVLVSFSCVDTIAGSGAVYQSFSCSARQKEDGDNNCWHENFWQVWASLQGNPMTNCIGYRHGRRVAVKYCRFFGIIIVWVLAQYLGQKFKMKRFVCHYLQSVLFI